MHTPSKLAPKLITRCSLAIAGVLALATTQAAIPPQTFTIGGTVTGLLGSDLILQNNRSELLSIESNGTFTFPSKHAIGESYNVFVIGQPEAPPQICTVANGSGVIKTTVTNIKVTCTGGGPPPMSFTGSAPVNGATGVSRTVQSVLSFSAPLDGTTISTDNVTLRDSFGAFVPELLGFSGSQLAVQGVAKLLPLTPYTVNVTTGLRGTGGQVLDHAVTVGFTTQDGQWQSPLTIGTNSNSARDSQIVMDPIGNAIAVWTQQNGGTFEIWSNRYRWTFGWGTPVRIGPAGVTSNFARVSVDAAGNALAVWQQSPSNGAPSSIWANRYTANVGWSTAAQIETHASGSAAFPAVSMEPNGSALATWTVPVGSVNRAVASRFTTTNGWTAPQAIDNNAGNAGTVVIAMDPNGNGTAVWNQSDGTRNNMWSNRFVAGAGWGAPVLIENNDAGSAFVPRVAVDSSGNAFALWQDSVGVSINLFANRFTVGGTWGTPQIIGTPAGNADAKIAVDVNGNAMVVWEQFTGAAGVFNITSNRYSTNTGWGTPTPVETHAGTRSFLPSIALDRSGNALAVWQQETPDRNRQNIFANRFTPAGGWGATPTQLTNNVGFTDSAGAQIAIDPRGDALAIWSQFLGSATFNMVSDRLE